MFRINGVEDHIYILSDLHPSVALTDFVKDSKVGSSIWMKASGLFPDFDGWAKGYGTFMYSIKECDRVINYTKKQKEHHRQITFNDEYKTLLKAHDIA